MSVICKEYASQLGEAEADKSIKEEGLSQYIFKLNVLTQLKVNKNNIANSSYFRNTLYAKVFELTNCVVICQRRILAFLLRART